MIDNNDINTALDLVIAARSESSQLWRDLVTKTSAESFDVVSAISRARHTCLDLYDTAMVRLEMGMTDDAALYLVQVGAIEERFLGKKLAIV